MLRRRKLLLSRNATIGTSMTLWIMIVIQTVQPAPIGSVRAANSLINFDRASSLKTSDMAGGGRQIHERTFPQRVPRFFGTEQRPILNILKLRKRQQIHAIAIFSWFDLRVNFFHNSIFRLTTGPKPENV